MTTSHRYLLLATVLVLGACSEGNSPVSGTSDAALGPTSVAVVNGQPIAESVLRVYALASERKNLDELAPADRERLLNDLIGVELLAQEAQKEGLTASRTLAAQLELQRLQLVARSMVTSHIEKNPPTEAEMQQVYDENLPRLASKQFKARHMLVETKEEADGIISQLRQGGDFVALAESRADGPTGPNGGALDWFTPESMPKPFADAVQAMAIGTYSAQPVQTEFGFHVILLEDSRQQAPPAFADIRSELSAAVERKRVEDYLKTLHEGATISVEP